MAKQTPEGKVKKRLLDYLKSLGDDCFYYMPVQNGMGQTGIPDVMAIIHRVPFAFECKATPKQHPTALQAMALDRIHKAGGVAWVVDNESVEGVISTVSAWCNADPTDTQMCHWRSFLPKDTEEKVYRWQDKLEVMEFEDATCG